MPAVVLTAGPSGERFVLTTLRFLLLLGRMNGVASRGGVLEEAGVAVNSAYGGLGSGFDFSR